MMKPTSRRLLRICGLLAVLFATGAYAFMHAGYWLEEPAQQPTKADAIAILGGDGEGERSLRALALYQQGYAPVLVMTGLQLGALPGPAAANWRAQWLESRGVPPAAIQFETAARNSYEEATNLLALMQRRGWRHIMVVSDPPHMRRLAWTWHRVFAGSGREYTLVTSQPSWWTPDAWWRQERSGEFVITEYIKLVYYAKTH